MECRELGWMLGGKPVLGMVKVGVWGPGLPADRWACSTASWEALLIVRLSWGSRMDHPHPWNSCEVLLEFSLNKYGLWWLVYAWFSLLWHLFSDQMV